MEAQSNSNPTAKSLNKPAYIIFVLAGIYFAISRDFSQAATFWGLALVFDPFDLTMPFSKRPFYQQAWLMAHLTVTIALFVMMILDK